MRLVMCILFLLQVASFGAGEYFSKSWATRPSWKLWALVVLLYGVSSTCWLVELKIHGQLAAFTALTSTAFMLVGVLMGIFMFSEVLTPRQVAGILLAVLACFLIY